MRKKKKVLHGIKKQQYLAQKKTPSLSELAKRNVENIKHGSFLDTAFYADKRYPENMNSLRIAQATFLTNDKGLSKPSSRMVLHEFLHDAIGVLGLVSDISIKNDGKKPSDVKLLIEYPTILWKGDHMTGKVGYIKETRIDSHIWIRCDEIEVYPDDNKTIISIGDVIWFLALPKEYIGRGDYGRKAYKYGLSRVRIVHSGVFVKDDGGNTSLRINGNFPRHNDWVIRIIPKKDGFTFKCKRSIYPSYIERNNQNKEGQSHAKN